MKLHRLVEDYSGDAMRAEADGRLTRGRMFVGEDGLVRWISADEVAEAERDGRGVGTSGAKGWPIIIDREEAPV